MTITERFFKYVRQDGDCWVWTGGKNPEGYGRFYLGQTGGRRTYVYPHRYAYQLFITEIPDGLSLDHLCRNRSCLNPWHLDPVTQAVNLRRGAGRGGVLRG